MIKVRTTIKSMSPVSWSRRLPEEEEKPRDNETRREHEERVWPLRLYKTDGGDVYIPAAAIKFAVARTAQYLGLKVPGKGGGKATFTKNFMAGVQIPNHMVVGNEQDTRPEWVWCSSTGRRGGGGAQVRRCYPVMDRWSGAVDFIISDDQITDAIFRQVWEATGVINGFGRFRPQNGGNLGMFSVETLEWGDF